MKVRVLFGPRAGDVVEYPYRVAQWLLSDGRAVLPEVDVTVPPEVSAVTSTRPDLEIRDEGQVRVYRKKKQGR